MATNGFYLIRSQQCSHHGHKAEHYACYKVNIGVIAVIIHHHLNKRIRFFSFSLASHKRINVEAALCHNILFNSQVSKLTMTTKVVGLDDQLLVFCNVLGLLVFSLIVLYHYLTAIPEDVEGKP